MVAVLVSWGQASATLLCLVATFLVVAYTWGHYPHTHAVSGGVDELVVCQSASTIGGNGPEVSPSLVTTTAGKSRGAQVSCEAECAAAVYSVPPMALTLRHRLLEVGGDIELISRGHHDRVWHAMLVEGNAKST